MNWWLLLVVWVGTNCQILSSVDINNLEQTNIYVRNNFVGLSFEYSQIHTSIIGETLLMQMIKNSLMFDNSGTQFFISVKNQVPKGYKHICSAYDAIASAPVACIQEMSPVLANLVYFLQNSIYSVYHSMIGFDMQGISLLNGNETNTQTVSLMQNYFDQIYYNVWGWAVPECNMFDLSDKWVQHGIRSNFTPQDFIAQLTAATSQFGSLYIYGPGVTQDAAPQWLEVFDTHSKLFTYSGIFTVRCEAFKTVAELTIQNMLDQSNYAPYLASRFSYNGRAMNIESKRITISQMRMHNGPGIDGVTNSFASALWALDISLEFAALGGYSILFPVDFDAGTLQSVFGPAPNFQPNPIYYSLLMLSSIQRYAPFIYSLKVKEGTSQHIKAWAFKSSGKDSLLLINKDRDPSKSGVVQVNLKAKVKMECTYLSADALDSTSGVKFAGYHFESGNSAPQGSHQSQRVVQEGMVYNVRLNHSQAVYCQWQSVTLLTFQFKSHEIYLSALISAILVLLLALA